MLEAAARRDWAQSIGREPRLVRGRNTHWLTHATAASLGRRPLVATALLTKPPSSIQPDTTTAPPDTGLACLGRVDGFGTCDQLLGSDDIAAQRIEHLRDLHFGRDEMILDRGIPIVPNTLVAAPRSPRARD
jgi:hypothetical protein